MLAKCRSGKVRMQRKIYCAAITSESHRADFPWKACRVLELSVRCSAELQPRIILEDAWIGRHDEKAAQPGMVWPKRPRRFYLPKLDEKSGLSRRPVRGTAGNRHLQYVFGDDALQLAFPRNCGVGETRRLGSGCISAGISCDVPGRNDFAADGNAVSQSGQHGCGRIHSRQSDGWCCAVDGLRQNDALAADGCGLLRLAHDWPLGRTDAYRKISRARAWFWHKHLADVRKSTLRRNERRGILRSGKLHAPFEGSLHDDGHGLDDGEHGRSARHEPARTRGYSPGGRAALHARTDDGASDRPNGEGRFAGVTNPEARCFRKRDSRERGDWRLDERCNSLDCDCGACGRSAYVE